MAWSVTPGEFRNYLTTNSAIIMMTSAERQEKRDSSQDVLQEACADAGFASVPLHHIAACFRWIPPV